MNIQWERKEYFLNIWHPKQTKFFIELLYCSISQSELNIKDGWWTYYLMRKLILAQKDTICIWKNSKPQKPVDWFLPLFHALHKKLRSTWFYSSQETYNQVYGFQKNYFSVMSKSHCSMCTSACNALTCWFIFFSFHLVHSWVSVKQK